MHRAVADYAGFDRMLTRVTVAGRGPSAEPAGADPVGDL